MQAFVKPWGHTSQEACKASSEDIIIFPAASSVVTGRLRTVVPRVTEHGMAETIFCLQEHHQGSPCCLPYLLQASQAWYHLLCVQGLCQGSSHCRRPAKASARLEPLQLPPLHQVAPDCMCCVCTALSATSSGRVETLRSVLEHRVAWSSLQASA